MIYSQLAEYFYTVLVLSENKSFDASVVNSD